MKVHTRNHNQRRGYTQSSTFSPQAMFRIVDVMNPPKCRLCGYPMTPGPSGVLWCAIYGSHEPMGAS